MVITPVVSPECFLCSDRNSTQDHILYLVVTSLQPLNRSWASLSPSWPWLSEDRKHAILWGFSLWACRRQPTPPEAHVADSQGSKAASVSQLPLVMLMLNFWPTGESGDPASAATLSSTSKHCAGRDFREHANSLLLVWFLDCEFLPIIFEDCHPFCMKLSQVPKHSWRKSFIYVEHSLCVPLAQDTLNALLLLSTFQRQGPHSASTIYQSHQLITVIKGLIFYWKEGSKGCVWD